MTLVTLFGRPGSGKSSVGSKLAECYAFKHLALGAMLKDPAFLQEVGIDPLEMEQAVASGRTIKTVELYPWLNKRIRDQDLVVVDGYPRAASSSEFFKTLLDSLPRARCVFAIMVDCSTAVTHARLKKRGRADDDERIHDRDDEFEMVQKPLFVELPPRVRRIKIDGSRREEEVFSDVERALQLTRLGKTV